jgi:hypothetical protein
MPGQENGRVYSKLFNAIFIHIPKTGGQSVEHVFVEKHGLTWRKRGPLLLRKNREPGQRPRHLAHLYASEYCDFGFIAPETFASCFRFTTVRNPYDRALSEYKYRNQRRALSFAEFLKVLATSEVDRHLVPQSKFVTDSGGKLLVEKIMRLESLADGFEQVSSAIFGQPVPLPHVNKSPEGIAPADMDEDTRNVIYKRYECDFDLFQYPSGRAYHNLGAAAARDALPGGECPNEYAQSD